MNARSVRSGGCHEMQHQSRSPENIRIENRKKGTRKVWASPEWKKAKKEFLARNPTCRYCGSPSTVPHHPDREVYGKPEYLNLDGTVALCVVCHNGIHSGRFPCPRCSKVRAKLAGSPCYGCLDKSDKERIAEGRDNRNERRNESNRAFYRKCHPKKVIDTKTGTWKVLK